VSSGSIGYSGTSLRFGLLGIKPVEFTETFKKAGMKFQRVIRRFESLPQPKSYAEMVNFTNEAIFSSIKIPDWFDSAKIVKEFSQYAIAEYDKDTEYKRAVENLKNNKDRIGAPLLSFVQYAKNKFESELDYYLQEEADRFLRSNFSLSFYNKLSVFDNTYFEFLKILEDTVRKYEFLARCARNFQMYDKHISEMKRHIGPIIDKVDSCFLEYFRLKHYIAVWNAKDYTELQNPKFLDINKLQYDEFERLSLGYYNTLTQTRSILLKIDENILSAGHYGRQDEIQDIFGRLATLPSGSLTL
jgi:hypothetical protein